MTLQDASSIPRLASLVEPRGKPRWRRASWLSVGVLVATVPAHAAEPVQATASMTSQEREALALVAAFAGELKPALKQALAHGGPTHAIDVCAVEAPAIAAALSERSGWTVRRVSLKPRNSHTAQPDEWAASVLQSFDTRRAAGETPATLQQSVTVDGEYRFMKAQPVEPVCLVCHGESIAPAVSAALLKRFPEDTATGYRLGDVRGAFDLRTHAKP